MLRYGQRIRWDNNYPICLLTIVLVTANFGSCTILRKLWLTDPSAIARLRPAGILEGAILFHYDKRVVARIDV